ncbi:MAG: hypothetical protein AMJ43_04700 [Coxiella sp. DG_40]|nr:MAG: hypothetical protein AMJ43_04700 [Coxiella sp. DG_40]
MKTEIKPCHSKYLTIFLCTIHLGTICCLLLLNLSIWLFILLTVLIGYSLYVTLQRYAFLKSSKAIIKLWKEKDNSWRLLNNENHILNAHLRTDSFVSRHLIILNFDIVKKFFTVPVLLCSDSLDKKTLRHLRVSLTIRNNHA